MGFMGFDMFLTVKHMGLSLINDDWLVTSSGIILTNILGNITIHERAIPFSTKVELHPQQWSCSSEPPRF